MPATTAEYRRVFDPPHLLSSRVDSCEELLTPRGIDIKIPLKQSIESLTYLQRGVDTTIVWVGGYPHNRYECTDTLCQPRARHSAWPPISSLYALVLSLGARRVCSLVPF